MSLNCCGVTATPARYHPRVIRLEEFVPERATPEQWRRYHAYRRRRHDEHDPEKPLAPDEAAETLMKHRDSFNHRRWFVATLDDRVVSGLVIGAAKPTSPEYATKRHLMWAEAWVLRDHRRQGIGRGWVPTVVDAMDGYGATVLSTGPDEDAGHAFVRWMGAEAKMVSADNRLDLREVDWDMVERWVRDGAAASPETRLELYEGRVPERSLDEFCTAVTRLVNLIPFEDLDHGDIVFTSERQRQWYQQLDKLGGSHHVLLSREPDGSISGETDVLSYPYEPGLVHQLLTAVDPAARGRKLGKWLKAAMLLHVRRTHPDTVWIRTENAGSNAPMLAINDQLGFRKRKAVIIYQVARDTLAKLQ